MIKMKYKFLLVIPFITMRIDTCNGEVLSPEIYDHCTKNIHISCNQVIMRTAEKNIFIGDRAIKRTLFSKLYEKCESIGKTTLFFGLPILIGISLGLSD